MGVVAKVVAYVSDSSQGGYECGQCGLELDERYHQCPECGSYRIERQEWELDS